MNPTRLCIHIEVDVDENGRVVGGVTALACRHNSIVRKVPDNIAERFVGQTGDLALRTLSNECADHLIDNGS